MTFMLLVKSLKWCECVSRIYLSTSKYYNDNRAEKYNKSARIRYIQEEISRRAIELMAITPGRLAYILDVGSGSGISGEVLEESGHLWVGVDISQSMLSIAQEREVEGDLFLSDIGQGLFFRPGTFDGAISISVVQWLCNSDKSSNIVKKRLARFFNTLYSCLARGARAVLQFYPENPEQTQLIMTAVHRAGFTGGLVIDYPNSSKAKKHYLCIDAGSIPGERTLRELPLPLTNENTDQVRVYSKNEVMRSKRHRKTKSSELSRREYVIHKKQVNVDRGKRVPRDSKYSGRKRSASFN